MTVAVTGARGGGNKLKLSLVFAGERSKYFMQSINQLVLFSVHLCPPIAVAYHTCKSWALNCTWGSEEEGRQARNRQSINATNCNYAVKSSIHRNKVAVAKRVKPWKPSPLPYSQLTALRANANVTSKRRLVQSLIS